jgi:hypothetical protein
METRNGRLLPRVCEHETNRELFWQIELPATDELKLSLEGRLLTVRVLHPAHERPDTRMHPEATAV